jgi:NitT/TauT family transport system substrate-binding protein
MAAGACALVPGLAAAQPAARTALTFHMDWKAQAEHGGFYQALATGLYARRGLDVSLRPGGPQTDNTRLLAAGAIPMGMVSNAFQAMTLTARGADVRMVMACFQKDPQMLMVHEGGPIRTIADMRGRPFYVDDAAIPSFFAWLKARHGFTDAQVRRAGFSIAPWLKDPTAIQDGYATSEPFTAMKAGAKPHVFLMADAGYPGYGAFLAVTGKFLAAQPNAVRAFVAATQQGWIDYLTGDPTPGNRLIRRDNPEMTDELIAFARGQMSRLGIVLSGEALTDRVGQMTLARWQAFRADAAALKLYPATLDLARVFSTAYLSPIRPPAAR